MLVTTIKTAISIYLSADAVVMALSVVNFMNFSLVDIFSIIDSGLMRI
jgi:hypothetical protein